MQPYYSFNKTQNTMATQQNNDIARLRRLALQEEAVRWKQTFASPEDGETLFKNIFDNIPVGVEIYNEAGILVDVNAEDLAMFGLQRKEDMLGIDLLHNPNIGPERTRIIMANDESRFHFDYDFALTRGYYKNNRTGTINLITKIRKLFGNNGQCIGYVMINIDNTANRDRELELTAAKEKAERADKLKSAFIANMSHEIRTPLNAIVGFSTLMADTDNRDERLMYQEIIEQNNTQLLKLVNDVLDLARIESGSFQMEKHHFDPTGLCSDVVASMSLKVQPGVSIRMTEGLSSCSLYSDRTRVSQVLTNLVENAVKFTPQGSITVGVECNEAENHVRFYVTDTGIGIPEEKQKKIFERFMKLDNFVPGSGLGLSICQSIVEELGGMIGVESQVEEGSTFWFTLPLE